MASTEIIICTEKGYLESMSKLLVWSIRNFGGRFSNLPIYSYQPRKEFKISRKTIRFFEQNEVHIVDDVLNSDYAHYPLANKPLATAHRESRTSAKHLIFLDSDIFFLKEPEDLISFNGHDLILRAVDHKNIGTEHPGDENAAYWQQLYNLLGVKAERKVRATSDNREILEYYNSGHLVTKTQNNLFSRWKENFIKVMKHDLKPKNDLFYVEQSTFAATITQMEWSVKQLEDYLNYPIFFLGNSPFTDLQFETFKDLVSIHYHKQFKRYNGINPIEPLLQKSSNGKIINKKIKEFKLLKKSNAFTKFFGTQRKRYDSLKQVLNFE